MEFKAICKPAMGFKLHQWHSKLNIQKFSHDKRACNEGLSIMMHDYYCTIYCTKAIGP